MTITTTNIQSESLSGLTAGEVIRQRELNGDNKGVKAQNMLLQNILSVVREPMFLLLVAACGIYFVLKEFAEAFTMLAALFFVAGIDVFQNFRSQKAVKALSHITDVKAKVIRDSATSEIAVADVVTQDILICEEGTVIPADAEIITSNDFSVNESILTGESVAVEKFKSGMLMQGTLVVRGYCYARVVAVGRKTALAEIGELVATTGAEQTPLQLKVAKFVKIMVVAGSFAFAFVWLYYWWESGDFLHGLLHGLTMAMSVLPEEIPVALSTFMALGAYRLLKAGVIARSPKTVETLGSATVICVDKTGTLTQNLMNVAQTFDFKSGEETDFLKTGKATEALEYAMWASEENPFDPMEKSIHALYGEFFKNDERKNFHMTKEFPLSGTPPTMTHIFKNAAGDIIIGCKGALEGVLKLCTLNEIDKENVLKKGRKYAANGLRVLGVAKGRAADAETAHSQEEVAFTFLGIITFYDPPATNIPVVIQGFYDAGVDVKMITGDYAETAVAIAKQTGIKTAKILTGSELSKLSDSVLKSVVAATNIFARVSPDVKLRIINSLKDAGEVVAMTGDGVNDAPALKAAHIGIAMGKRGTDVAKGAAGLILSGDDLSKMIDAIFLGRRINENLLKAIRYIISIHIPIILLVTAPIFLPWLPQMIFTPVHVIFFELIMGPTCSIIYENEPIPDDELKLPARAGNNLLNSQQLFITIIQGLIITLGCIFAGYFANNSGFGEMKIRAYIFSTLIFSNIFLTLVNRSFSRTFLKTIRMKNTLIPVIIAVSILLLILIFTIPPLRTIFSVSPLSFGELLPPLLISFAATFWIEIVKSFKNFRKV